jgi:CYTH domain-containing protein
MNKTAVTEYHRLFLIEKLPEPLEARSAHLQIFDNYIIGTRLRIRLVRDPVSGNWTRILQQTIEIDKENLSVRKIAEIHLNDMEYSHFEHFEGREVRKNRYFHEFDGLSFAFDVYLGDLLGLNTTRIQFASAKEMQAFEPPPFAVLEITNDAFFVGKDLVGRRFEDVRVHVQQIGVQKMPAPMEFEDQ